MKRNIKITILILFLIFIVGGSIFAFFYIKKGATIPFVKKTPEQVLQLMDENSKKIVNYKTKTEANIKTDINLGIDSPFSMMMDEPFEYALDIDYSDEASFFKENEELVNSQHHFKFDVDMEDIVLRADMETRKVDGKDYVKLNTIPSLITMFIDMVGKEIAGRWFIVGNEEEDADVMSDQYGFPDKEGRAEVEEAINTIVDNFKKAKTLRVKEELANEKVNDVDCHHYVLDINKETIDSLEQAFIDYVNEETDEDDEDREKLFSQLDKMIGDSELEIWIGKKDYYLRKAKFKFSLDLSDSTVDYPEQIEGMDDVEMKLDLEGTYEVFDINTTHKVEAPEKAIRYDDLLDSYYYDIDVDDIGTEKGDRSLRDAERISDVKQMQTALELYFNDFSTYPSEEEFVVGESFFKYHDVEDVKTTYMALVPNNPKSTSENCPEDFEYVYKFKSPIEYTLKYCLEEDSEAYWESISAGYHTASPSGLVEGEFDWESDFEEEDNGLKDSDGDALFDDDEINLYGTDPNNPDTDGDGLPDFEEVIKYETDPLKIDTDGDGYSDADEIDGGYDPNSKPEDVESKI